jgi:hypothetical protein
MLQKIRKSKTVKLFAAFMALNFIVEIISPSLVFALTGGPSQPEVQSFEPIGTSEMVDLFSGDFNYNIPLMDVGGYPLNLAYHSGVTMDQEASWVGLGWNINPGAITRNMRGLPDDFNGDMVEKEFNIKPNETYGANAGFSFEAFGVGSLGLGMGIQYNNYTGVGVSTSINPSVGFGGPGETSMTAGLGISSGPEGLTISPSVSLSANIAKHGDDKYQSSASIGMGTSYNSRAGLRGISFNAGTSLDKKNGKKEIAKHGKNKGKEVDSYSNVGSAGGGSSVDIGGSTYVPNISFPMYSNSISFNARIAGVTFFGVTGSLTVGGSYSVNALSTRRQSLPGFGYNRSENGQHKDYALMDFNREKDLPYSRRVPTLPVTNYTYDIYSIAGQGVGGMYRPYRSEVGYVYDSRSIDYSGSGSLGLEIGVGQAFHAGADVSVNSLNSSSGKWTSNNTAAYQLKFKNSESGSSYEPYYFKQVGEKNVESSPTFISAIRGDKLVSIDVDALGGSDSRTTGRYSTASDINGNYGDISTSTNKPFRDKRQRRTLSVSKLTKDEAHYVGLDKGDEYYDLDLNDNPLPKHHNAEFTVTNNDGSRYVYGLPLLNTLQEEVSFNVSGRTANCSTGLVNYEAEDATTNNTRGADNFYSSTKIPAYTHSYMLTAVLSADYVDRDGDGPDEDDLGSYTKFIYEEAEAIDGYKWRVPYQANTANYEEGYRSLEGNNGDDKGSFVYGEKNIKYLTKIETRTHVAVFTLSSRHDASEVLGRDGGQGSRTFKKLDKITLYTKPDYDENELDLSQATPIKTVHFVYDYSLCPNVPNNDEGESGSGDINEEKGKLTLTQVYFTYQKSNKGRLNPYTFTYKNTYFDGVNNIPFDYDLKDYERWGNYKPNNTCSSALSNNSEYPYTVQEEITDDYASAWTLTDISLPSGGIIHMDYESDDYAFVQDRDAYQMYKVAGIGTVGGTELGSGALRIYFDVPSGDEYSPTSNIEDYVADIINKDGGYMYFNFLTDILRNSSNDEFVRGYCKINSSNMGYDNGHFYVEVESMGGDHPISKAAWQFGRLNIPRVVYNQPSTNSSIMNVIIDIATAGNLFANVLEMIQGPDGYYRQREYGEQVNINKSYIRLMNPIGIKKGGGSRVSKITMNDNWGEMTDDEQAFDYGQEYNYTKVENGRTISSGVAANEPQVGADESSLKHPIFYGGAAKALAPDGEHYVETPMGESFYPSAGVGYSKVSVKNLTREDITVAEKDVKRHATGHVVHEFYTARDFPTKWSRSLVDPITQRSQPLAQVFNFSTRDYMTVSQGYLIELNDMHGKQKAQYVYAEDKPTQPISSVTYHYKQAGNKLDNKVTVIDKSGYVVPDTEVGVEYDMVADFREYQTHASTAKVAVNFEMFFAFIFPIFVPPIWPGFSENKTRFRSAITTKVVNRFGILEKTVATDLGSRVETKNLAYDSETGEVLLTETINNFDDPVYNFTYPAHWSYDRMGGAYQNIEYTTSVTSSSGEIDNENGLLLPGDEILVDGTSRAWIWDDNETDDLVYMIDRDGELLTSGTKKIKVIRSGRRNLQTTPIGSITSLKNPLYKEDGTTPYLDAADAHVILYCSTEATDTWKILSANAIEFSEKWKTHLNSFCQLNQTGQNYIDLFNALLSNQSDISYANDFVNEEGVILTSPDYDINLIESFCSGELVWTYNENDGNLTCEESGLIPPCFEIEIIQSNYVGASFDNLISMEETYNYNPEDDFIYLIGNWPDNSKGIIKFTHTCRGSHPVSMNILNCETSYCENKIGKIVNPYIQGIRGNWRAERSNLYLNNRVQRTETDNNLDIRYDGVYESFSPFWERTGIFPYKWTKDNMDWIWTSEVTEYSPYGMELENRDALNRFSSAIYGYNDNLPIAVAKNAPYRNIGFDGFEDYSSKFSSNSCLINHFDFYQYGKYYISQLESHSGKWSLKLESGHSMKNTRNLTNDIANEESDDVPYTYKSWDDLGVFSPITENISPTFILSYWVKEDLGGLSNVLKNDVESYTTNNAAILINGTVQPNISLKKSKIINGWQKVDLVFNIALDESGIIEVAFVAGANDAYFDDIRIQPVNSSMKTYVYDEKNYRLMAELDDNNFATFYEYDEEGALTRIKKETERGIVTIQESRNSKFKALPLP